MHMIFLDTEFTSFHRPSLLSIGMVSLNDAREFYAELDMLTEDGQQAWQSASEFVRGPDVLGQWSRVAASAGNLQQMARRCSRWLADELTQAQGFGDGKLMVCSDYGADFKFLVELLRRDRTWDLLGGRLRYQDISGLLSGVQADRAVQQCFEELAATRGLRQHHALADALAIRQGFMALRGA